MNTRYAKAYIRSSIYYMVDPICTCHFPREYSIECISWFGINDNDNCWPECVKCRREVKKTIVHNLEILYKKRQQKRIEYAMILLNRTYHNRLPSVTLSKIYYFIKK